MATLNDLAEISDAAYGTPSAIKYLAQQNIWHLLSGTDGKSTVTNDNYFGVAYQNSVTGEIVISNRGTLPTKFRDLLNDAELALHVEPAAAIDAVNYALQIAKDNPTAAITETGHSLGGYEAQVALAALVDKKVDVNATAVTFNAPALAGGLYGAPSSSYNVLNLYNQGDVIHLVGGTHLGVTAALAAGPTQAAEIGDAALGFLAGAAFGGLPGIALGGALLSKDFLKAHFIATTIAYFATTPGQGQAGETMQQFIAAGQGFTPSSLATVSTTGTVQLTNSGGDAVSMSESTSSPTTATLAVGSDGLFTPSANAAALNAELAADGSATVSETQASQTITALAGASAVYATASSSTDGPGVVIGPSPPSESAGEPTQVYAVDGTPDGRFDFNVPTDGAVAAETINGGTGIGSVWVDSGNVYARLKGGAALSQGPDTWKDASGTTYVFTGDTGSQVGTLLISGGSLGNNPANAITIQNFNLASAQRSGGFLGIVLPAVVDLNAAANAGVDPPAPNFVEGTNQSYTLSVDAPSATVQTFTVSLSGAAPSDFEVTVGDTIEPLNSNGTFSVSLAAGQTNVSFALIDATTDNGSSDIAGGTHLTLTASLPNPDTLAGGAIQAAPLTFGYIPTSPDTSTGPNLTNLILGTYDTNTGNTDYLGDGANDYIIAGAGPNYINATSSGNDSIIGGTGNNTIYGGTGNDVTSLVGSQDLVSLGGGFNTVYGGTGKDTIYSNNATAIISGNNGSDVIIAGDGTNEIYAGAKTSLANAIAAAATATATGQQGDLIAVGDGNNTVIGSNGNDFITTDDSFQDGTGGADVIVLGAGNDTYLGGTRVDQATGNWSVSLNGTQLTFNNITFSPVDYFDPYAQDPYAQPYNGNLNGGLPVGAASATIFGGTGNDLLELANGNNFVEVGSGNSSVYGGMGNDTIIAGSAADFIQGGGGTTYIVGGPGADTITGGDGDNTIIGGSGNATIRSSSSPNGINFTNANLDQNYVTGGSGNDVIYGSAGQDTLIAGTGNTTIYGQTGNEYIVGGSGNDLLYGGTGNNTLVASGSGIDSLYADGASTSSSILYGGNGKDYIVGGSGSNILYAGDGGAAGGATSVIASQGDSTANTIIYGGLGVDFLQAGPGSTIIYAGNGGTSAAATTLIGSSGNATLYGGLGTDLVQGGSGTNVLYAGDGGTATAPTTVIGGTGVSTLYGGAGSSLLEDNQSGQDLLVSGTANDSMFGIGNDTLVAGSGNDFMQAYSGSVNFEFRAGFGNATITSAGGAVNLLLGPGLLTTDFTGSVGFDTMGNSYLNLSGDGGSIAIENALTGVLASAVYVDPSSIPLATLFTDVFGGDQTVASGSNNFIINLGNSESIAAGTYNDTISSWGSNDTIKGGTSNNADLIYSGGSAASIASGSGGDSITGTGANDSIVGGTSGDHITVTGANALVTSSSGNDSITASGSADTLVGGTGKSTFYVNNASTVIQVSLGGGIDTVVASVSYTAPTNVNVLTLTGSANIMGTGNSGSDTLTAGAGQDTLVAGAGAATLIGGTGNTIFVLNSASDLVQDSSTTTVNVVQTSLSYVLATNVNSLVLTGSSSLSGTANNGNDSLTSNTGIDTLVGGSGNDTFVINNVGDIVQDTSTTASNTAQSSVNYALAANVNTLVLGGTAALQGTANSGADTLISNSGIDTLVGGSGNDTFIVNNALDVVQDTSTSASNSIQSSVSYTLPTNVNALTLTGTASLSAGGNTAANVITANSGNDTLIAGSGVATLIGGSGNGTFVVNNVSDVVQDSSTTASNTIQASVSYALAANVNNLVLTGSANLTGTANSGNDTLASNSGADTLVGGSGNDTFVVNNIGDVVQDSSATASNIIQSSVSYTLPTNVNTLVLTGTAALTATSNSGNDSLVGNAGSDVLVATSGLDTLVAGNGIDTLVGAYGRDLLVVNNAADVVNVGGGGDTIQSSVSYTLPANVNDTLVLTGSANLAGTAVSGNNVIIGNAGNDTLTAGSGYDTLVAGSGVDTLVGGSSTDNFVINNASDVVLDTATTVPNGIFSSVSYTVPTNVDSLTLTGSANLLATGNAQTDYIHANDGNDTLTAGSGVATFFSGHGSDLFVVNNASDVVASINDGLKFGADTIQSSVSYSLSSVSVLVLTGSANLSGTGGSSDDETIVGNAGQDTLSAGTSAATLVAGTGADLLYDNAGGPISTVYEFGTGFGQDTIGQITRGVSNSTILFGTGIEPGNLTISANATGNSIQSLQLVLSDGTGSVDVLGGLAPGVISKIAFADTGSESLTQFMNAAGLGTVVIPWQTSDFVLSTGAGQSVTADVGNNGILAYGNNDTINSNGQYASTVYTYGNSDSITTGANVEVFAGGGADSINVGVDAAVTLVGGSNTVVGAGSNGFTLYKSSTVIQEGVGSHAYINAYASYSLPTNVQSLSLRSDSISAVSNAQGGTLIAGGNFDTVTGGSGRDTLIAAGVNDSLIGGSGAEMYVLQFANDTIQFGTGNASLNAVQAYFNYTLSGSANTLTEYAASATGAGNSGNDLIAAGSIYDTLIAGSGTDTLIGGSHGLTTLVGGSGNDTFIIQNADDVILDTSTTASNTLNSFDSYTLPTHINTLNLMGYAKVGTANSGNDLITANASKDTLVAGTGSDTLAAVAGSGLDTFVFNSGFGQDQIASLQNGNVIEFGPGIFESSLTFTALPGTGGAAPSLVISGDGGAVTMQGGLAPGAISSVQFNGGGSYTVQQLVDPSGRVTIAGTNGNLILTANNGDSLIGGSGRDTVLAWGNNDTLNAGTGGTAIDALGTGEQVTGGAATDSLVAYGANSSLIGGSGTETLVANGANDTLVGGAGTGNLYVNDPSTVISVTAGVGHDTVNSSVSYVVPNNVSVFNLIGTGSIQATANSGNDLITGNAGPDIFVDGGGADTFVGGSGGDRFYVNNTSDVVQASSSSVNETVYSTVNFSLPSNVNSLILLGSANLIGTGNAGNDVLTSGLGNDELIAGSGNDTLIGYYDGINVVGSLTLVGGAGADSLFAGNSEGAKLISGTGLDTLVSGTACVIVINNAADVLQLTNVVGQAPIDTIQSSISYALATGIANNTAYNASIDWSLTGSNSIYADAGLNDGAFTILGNAGADTITGGTGNNELIAGSGIDTLIAGGSGSVNDFFINNAADVIVTQAGSTNSISSLISYTLPSSINALYLKSANLIGAGNGNNDILEALVASNDTLVAGNGSDTLISNKASNTLIAGTGNDLVEYSGGDTIVLNSGFGNSQVRLFGAAGAATVLFGSGITGSNLTASAVLDTNGNAALAIANGASTATLDGALSNQTYQFNFNGGGNLTLAQFLQQVHVTTSSVVGAGGSTILEGTASVALAGGTGNDTIYGTAGSDTITGGSGNQVLNALGASDSIIGGSASDTLTGLGANDTLVAGPAIDTLIGGTGAAVTFVINNTGDVIQLQTTPGSDTVDSSVAYSLPTNVNMLILTGALALKGTANNGADTLTSNAALDTLIGGSGNDVFVVNNSSDVIQDTSTSATNSAQSSVSFSLASHVNTLILTGTAALTGTGNTAADTLTSNSGIDTLIGGTGNDLFMLNNASDVVQDTTSSTSNTVQAGFNYVLPTNVNSLILTGTSALTGTANSGNDTLTSNTGVDTLAGGSGNDTFVINNSSDVIQDTSTTATNSVQTSVSYSLATNVNSLTLTGTSALMGTANNATDTLTSNTGVDTLVGGSGNDTFVINSSSDVVQDTSTTATNMAKSGVSYSLPTNVNTLLLTGSTNIVGTANAGNDSLTGNSGTDTLIGSAGVDTLVAGSGVDTLIGGTGTTTFVINSASDVVQDTSTTLINTLRSSVTYVLPTNVNTLVLTGTLAVKGTANAGNDTLTSNTAIDTLVGGSGNDTFVISNASDAVQDTSTSATNVIQSTVNFSLPTNVNSLIFTGSTALHGTGNSGNDSMVANTGADTLSAGNGTDTLVSSVTGTAIDSLVGGTGNDLFIVNYAGDIVTVGGTHGADTIQSSVSYAASANVANLTLTGTAALAGTGSALAGKITANSGADTLTAGGGADTLVGGSGNDAFVVNSASDVVQDTSATATNILSSSVSYTLVANVNRLILTGTAALVGTANSGNDTLTANTGADTLISGAGAAVDSLVGGTGANLFVVNNASDIVNVGSTHGVDTIQSSVSYTASANVANLTLTGTSALAGTGNSLAGTIIANTGNDTLTAGSGADTLVGSSTGTDLFVVNSASDVVSLGTSGTSDTIQSSASYTLPTNVQYLTLTGTSALAGTGNNLLDLIVGNTGNDTLTGGTGIAALEGGRTAGSDQIKALSNQAALIAGGGSSTLTGGAFKDFYAAGKVSDTLTTGATANVVSVNKGDGLTTLAPTTSATNVLSLGAGIDTESLFFTKTGNNLILTDGVSGDSIAFTNWYVGSADQTVTNLQVVEIASANYNSGGGDALRNKALEDFNFSSLVAAYNTAGSPANWALSTAMPSAQLSSSSTADYGGDLAYYFGLNGNLTGVDLSAVQSTLTNASFGTAAQTIDAFSSISGGGGLHLLAVKPGAPSIQPITQPQASNSTLISSTPSSTEEVGYHSSHIWRRGYLPELGNGEVPVTANAGLISPRRGIEVPRSEASGLGFFTPVTAADAARVVTGPRARETIEPVVTRSTSAPNAKSYVDRINVAWLRMHGALDETNEVRIGGAESTAAHEEIAADALLGSAPLDRIRRTIGGPDQNSPLERRRAM
jgi:Ca2+-binding RTX toxin-like protein